MHPRMMRVVNQVICYSTVVSMRRTISSPPSIHHFFSCLSVGISSSAIPFGPTLTTSPPSTDIQNSLQVIENEIRSAEQRIQEIKIPDRFPFKIEDKPGLQTVSLKSEYAGEIIQVKVHLPGTGFEEEEEEAIALDISVAKLNGQCFELGCTALPGWLGIKSLSVKNRHVACKGPYNIDGPLMLILPKYLGIRGMDEIHFTDFLCEYMVNKARKEYLMWLKSVKNFMDDSLMNSPVEQ